MAGCYKIILTKMESEISPKNHFQNIEKVKFPGIVRGNASDQFT